MPSAWGGAIVAGGMDRSAVERITAEDRFIVAGVRYTVTTIDPGRVHRALADVRGVEESRVRG